MDVYKVVGESVEITCNITGEPTPRVRWYKNGEVVSESNNFTINEVTPKDDGLYTCVGVNPFGIVQTFIFVNIRQPPRATVWPKNYTVSRGGHVVLHCNASGFPLPGISWSKGHAESVVKFQ